MLDCPFPSPLAREREQAFVCLYLLTFSGLLISFALRSVYMGQKKTCELTTMSFLGTKIP